nr:CcdC protein domain-containing protein [Ectobacillus funiculus]
MNGIGMYGIIIVIAGLVFWRRTRAMVHPIQGSGIKILLPMFYLIPGIYAFSSLQMHLKIREMAVAALIGALLAVPLMLLPTMKFVRMDRFMHKKITPFLSH